MGRIGPIGAIPALTDQSRFRLFYFLLFAAGGGFGVFRNAYLQEVGFSGSQIGLVGFLIPIVSILAQPVWGGLSDRWSCQKEVLLVCILAAGTVVLIYPRGARAGFLVLASVTASFALFRAPIRPVANSLVLSTGLDFGGVRAFGSAAFGIAVLFMGFAVSWFGTEVVFVTYGIGMALAAYVLNKVPVTSSPAAESIGLDAVGMLRDRDFAALLFTTFLMGTLLSTASTYFSIYMRAVGAGDAMTGVALLVKTIGEVIVFLVGVRLSISYRTLLFGGCFAHVVTFLTYVFVPTAPAIVAVQLLLGAGFAGFYLAAVNLSHILAPERIASTAQTLLAALGFGAGAAAGQLVAGQLMQLVGIRTTYGYIAILGVVAAAVSLTIDSGESFADEL